MEVIMYIVRVSGSVMDSTLSHETKNPGSSLDQCKRFSINKYRNCNNDYYIIWEINLYALYFVIRVTECNTIGSLIEPSRTIAPGIFIQTPYCSL